jgi:hypothetical protein
MRNILRFPQPIDRTLPDVFAHGDIVRRFVPSELILPRMLSVAHCPIARRTTTEKTPIIIPREESHALILLESIFFTAVLAVRIRFMGFCKLVGYVLFRLYTSYYSTILPSRIFTIRFALAQTVGS